METKSYDYTEDEYQEAFEKVKRDYVGQAKSEKSPRLIFATGQPASGKSALPKKIIKDYPNVSFILIDMDKYRMYHPRLKEIENDNTDFVQSTNRFSIRIEKEMLEYCLENKINFIHIGTMRIYEYLKQVVIDRAKTQGFDIEVYALAVSNERSKISALLREQEQKRTMGNFYRKTSESFIDEADEGFKRSVGIMSDSPDITNIKILIRGQTAEDLPVLVYNQKKDRNGSYSNAYQALISIRQRQVNRKKEKVRDDIEDILKIFENEKVKPAIATNGILLNEKIINQISKSCITLQISLDTLNKDIYTKLRGTDNLYRVKDNIRLAKKYMDNVRIVTVLNRYNENELEEIYKFVEQNNIKQWFVFNLLPSGRGAKNYNELSISNVNELKQKLKALKNKSKEVAIWYWGESSDDGIAIYLLPDGTLSMKNYLKNTDVQLAKEKININLLRSSWEEITQEAKIATLKNFTSKNEL